MPQPINIPGTGTPGKPLTTKTTQVQPAPITFDAPPASKFGATPTIDLNAAAKNAGQANQADLDQYFKQNNADEYAKQMIPTKEDIDAAVANTDGRSLSPAQRAKERADKWAAANSKAATSTTGEFKTDMTREQGRPLVNPTVADTSRGSVSETPIADRKGPQAGPATSTPVVKKTPEEKKKEDWTSALGNLFSGNNIGNLVGGLGAAIESAYGNRGFADTLFGKQAQMEEARKAELERLGKSQEYDTTTRKQAQEFAASESAKDRANRLAVSGNTTQNAKQNDVAKALLTKWMNKEPLTADQIKILSAAYGEDPLAFASGKLPQVPGSKAFD